MCDMTDVRADLETLGRVISDTLHARGWSIRTLAMYAEISSSTASALTRGKYVPAPETLRAVAHALELDEAYLLRLAGHLEETPQGLNDPSVIALAYRLEDLPPSMRQRAIQAMDAMIEMAGPTTLSEIDRRSRIAELKKAIREAQKYLESLESGGSPGSGSE